MTDLLAHQSHASIPQAFQSHHCKETKGPAAVNTGHNLTKLR